jgi:hypothetical protein
MRRVRLPIGHATGTSALPLPHKYLREKGARAWIRRLFNSTSKTRYLALRALTAEYDAQVKAAEDARNKEELYSSDMLPYVSDEIDSVMLEDFSVVYLEHRMSQASQAEFGRAVEVNQVG